MTKKVISTLMALAMLLSLVCVMSVPASAAAENEGDWTTYRAASQYPPEGYIPAEGEAPKVYLPEAGYTYTEEGFTVVPADYKDTHPFMTVQTKEPQYIKDGVYLQFRVDEYSYAGDDGADYWMALTLTNKPKVDPGATKYGGGWSYLCKGPGVTSTVAVTKPDDGDVAGYFKPIGFPTLTNVPTDDEGREIYTLEIMWNNGGYSMLLNGESVPGAAAATEMLESIDDEGNFYVGVTLYSMQKDGKAALTILKYGTSEGTASTPVGSDSKEPEENQMVLAPIADPNTIEPNMPAILLNPETITATSGYNCKLEPMGDNTWRVSASDDATFFNLSPKRSISYDAKDFPVVGVMFRNTEDITTGTIWYAAGDVLGPQDGYNTPLYIEDGRTYKSDKGDYVSTVTDLSGLWEGRINTIRLSFTLYDGAAYDVCYVGCFRSEAEANAYAENYLKTLGVDISAEATTVAEIPTDPEEAADDETASVSTASAETAVGSEVTNAPESETDKSGKGCKSVISFGAAATVLALAYIGTRKKKD